MDARVASGSAIFPSRCTHIGGRTHLPKHHAVERELETVPWTNISRFGFLQSLRSVGYVDMFSSWPAPESMIFEVSFRTRSDHGWRPVGSRIRRTTRTRPGGAAGGSCAKRPHSRSPGHDPPNPASPSTTGPSAERAREQQQGAYAVGFSLGGGLALCQHADRTIIYLYGLTLRHQHASADNPCGAWCTRTRPHPSCLGGDVLPQGACVC